MYVLNVGQHYTPIYFKERPKQTRYFVIYITIYITTLINESDNTMENKIIKQSVPKIVAKFMFLA